MADEKKKTIFDIASPYLGFCFLMVCAYYKFHVGVVVEWYVFGIAGAMMGLGKAFSEIGKLKP